MEDEVMPPFLITLSSILKANGSNSNGVLVGSGVTYADLYVAHMMSRMQIDSEELKEKYPEIVAHRDLVFGIPSVKAYIEKRPVTPI
jgi:glutathione S-transferase